MQWDYYSESIRQLKTWLDPDNTGTQNVDLFVPPIKTISPVSGSKITLQRQNTQVTCCLNLEKPLLE